MNNWCSSSPHPTQQLKIFSKYIGGDTFLDYEKDLELEKILVNKRIALVGPSRNLEGKGMGTFIDSFDLVIRPGQLTFMPENQFKDYGSRTDIVFHSFNVWEKNIAKENLPFLQTLKYLVGCMVCANQCNDYDSFVTNLREQNINFHKPNDRYIFKLFAEVGTTLSCGVSSLLILLNYPIESIYLTGMDFYNMGKYGKVYRDDYYDLVTKKSMGYLTHNSNKLISPSEARIDLHDQKTQIEFIKNLSKKENRIKFDEYLSENLFNIQKN